MKTVLFFFFKLAIATSCYLLIAFAWMASAASVTLQWDANNPNPEGYRLYVRQSGKVYDYLSPAWTGKETMCTLSGLDDGITYAFVVRAYDGTAESADSNEVMYMPQGSAGSLEKDSDGDNVSDALDAFPNDPSEWLDTDGDGIGDNADLDDDGDGMPDAWEMEFGLNPLIDDAQQDLDGDGVRNYDEFLAGSDPSQVVGNLSPARPLLAYPQNGEVVGLKPTLKTQAFSDSDGDTHAGTLYQISTTQDFKELVYEYSTRRHLTALALFEMLLDPDSLYYWRVKFYDSHNGASEWSAIGHFRTIDYEAAGDADGNGVLDHQELDEHVDLDGNGVADRLQVDMLGVKTSDPLNPYIAIQKRSPDVVLAGAQSIQLNQLSLDLNRPDQMTGLISFKLFLDDSRGTATLTVHLTHAAPPNARWYKYDPESGWAAYPHVFFSKDRKSISIMLEDGGVGDLDGVKNGIIIDPSGLGYTTSAGDSWTSVDEGGAGGGCFIQGVLSSIKMTLVSISILIIGVTMAIGGTITRRGFRPDK